MENLDINTITKVHEAFRSKGLTLAVSESFTAGLVSHGLTSLAGASEFFDSASISFSRASQERLIGKSLMEKHGAVSEEAARAMAEAVRGASGADVCLAITGNPGPGGLDGMDPGLVFVAVAAPGQTTSRGFKYDGSPNDIRRLAAAAAAQFLYEAVSVWT
ncbi:MAG: hypothetical protein Kow0025_22180 [Thermodesulfovibrionales bacterium]